MNGPIDENVIYKWLGDSFNFIKNVQPGIYESYRFPQAKLTVSAVPFSKMPSRFLSKDKFCRTKVDLLCKANEEQSCVRRSIKKFEANIVSLTRNFTNNYLNFPMPNDVLLKFDDHDSNRQTTVILNNHYKYAYCTGLSLLSKSYNDIIKVEQLTDYTSVLNNTAIHYLISDIKSRCHTPM